MGGPAAPCPQPHLAGYAVLPMQKLMMLGTYKAKHKKMGSSPITIRGRQPTAPNRT